MFSSLDKALVALVMSVLSILSMLGVVLPDWATGANVAAVITGLTPILVYLIPNKS